MVGDTPRFDGEGKSYGGFSARFAAREGTVLRADDEVMTRMRICVRDDGQNSRRFTAGRKLRYTGA